MTASICGLSVLDPALVERVASDLRSEPGLIEKDWHMVRSIGVIAGVETAGMMVAFSGGTSLSKGWALIKRFSEDIDFKVAELPASASAARRGRTAYRQRVLEALAAAGFRPEGAPVIGNASRFFSAALTYDAAFGTGPGLRPHIRVEMSFRAPSLSPIGRPVGSLIAAAQHQSAEVASFPCVDPVETAADKLSALAWRVRARQRGSADDDPTIIRHLHDLAALESAATAAPNFAALALAAAADDAGRGGAPADPATIFREMLARLESDRLWAREYADFVDAVSFAAAGEEISFAVALDAIRRLIQRVC